MPVPVKIYNSGGQLVSTTGSGTASNPTSSGWTKDLEDLNYLTPVGIGQGIGKIGTDTVSKLGGVGKTASDIGSADESIAKAALFVTDPTNWLRIGEIIAGGILMLIGIIAVGFTLGGKEIKTVAGVVTKAAEYAVPGGEIASAIKSQTHAPAKKVASKIRKTPPPKPKAETVAKSKSKPKVEYRGRHSGYQPSHSSGVEG